MRGSMEQGILIKSGSQEIILQQTITRFAIMKICRQVSY
jgi:hypothetical protein